METERFAYLRQQVAAMLWQTAENDQLANGRRLDHRKLLYKAAPNRSYHNEMDLPKIKIKISSSSIFKIVPRNPTWWWICSKWKDPLHSLGLACVGHWTPTWLTTPEGINQHHHCHPCAMPRTCVVLIISS